MYKMRYTALIALIVLLFYGLSPHMAYSLDGAGKKPSANEDIKKILDEKLLKYDQSHRVLRRYDNHFSLDYNKDYGRVSRLEGVQSPMVEQQNRLNDFKNLTMGPYSNNEGFYGFRMKIPVKP